MILNHQWQEGQSSSIRLGTEQARGAGYLYLPSDQPLLTPKMLQLVLDKCQRNKIVVPLQKMAVLVVQYYSVINFDKNY